MEELLAFPGGDVQAAVAEREVEPAVGPERQAVQVVAEEGDVDAEAMCQGLDQVGLAGAFGVLEEPEVGNAGVVDVALARQHAGADAVGGEVKAIGEDGGFVGDALALAVLDQADAVVLGLIGARTCS